MRVTTQPRPQCRNDSLYWRKTPPRAFPAREKSVPASELQGQADSPVGLMQLCPQLKPGLTDHPNTPGPQAYAQCPLSIRRQPGRRLTCVTEGSLRRLSPVLTPTGQDKVSLLTDNAPVTQLGGRRTVGSVLFSCEHSTHSAAHGSRPDLNSQVLSFKKHAP